MRRGTSSKRWLELAALARIAERSERTRSEMMTNDAVPNDQEFKANVRRAWALGDYDRFAQLVWEVGPIVVGAAGVRPGQRVLDVAAGTGNTAIRAAQAGGRVIASDLTPEHFEAGRRSAQRAGVRLEWVEADAEALPFKNDEFDVVTSSFGAMFAPRHDRVARELVRVCKSGGTIAMANFTPEGLLADFFAVFAAHMPPPREGDQPPILWGSEDHVRALFGSNVSSLEMTRKSYIERAASPRAYRDFVKATFGPVVAIYDSLADRPDDAAALDQAFLRFVEKANQGPSGGAAELAYEYLLIVAKK
jgi:ubiquinone/menaquinone biosynthesis C-methylase UbiE